VKVAEEDCCKTAFWGPDGLYEWVVMPFGLKNAPAFFQRIMDSTLRTCRDFARCCIDDVIVYGKSFEEHLTHLRATFARIRKKGVKLHPMKMKLAMRSVPYLGHEIVPNGTAPQQAKVDAIVNMPAPQGVTQLRAVLGSVIYYQTAETKRDRYPLLRIFKGRQGRTRHRKTCNAFPVAGPYHAG
jgi:hypothetical protein